MEYGGVPVLFVGFGGFFTHWELSVSALAADTVFSLVVAAGCGAVAMWLPRPTRDQ